MGWDVSIRIKSRLIVGVAGLVCWLVGRGGVSIRIKSRLIVGVKLCLRDSSLYLVSIRIKSRLIVGVIEQLMLGFKRRKFQSELNLGLLWGPAGRPGREPIQEVSIRIKSRLIVGGDTKLFTPVQPK